MHFYSISYIINPLYAMRTILLPKRFLNELESLNRNFFWADEEQKKSMHLTAWNLICQDKKKGGLGLKNLPKLALQMCKSPNSL